MVNIPKGFVGLYVPIPEHIKSALESEIFERCGYLRRGMLSQVVTEALQEFVDKTEFERNKKIQKNGYDLTGLPTVVRYTPHPNRKKAKTESDTYRIVDEIFRRSQDGKILDINLRNIIVELFGVKDDRALDNYLKPLLAKKILLVDTESLPVIRYKILIPNPSKELPALK